MLTLINKFYPSVELKVVFSRGFKIRNLFAYKDKFPMKCRSMLVYYTKCSVCGPSQAYLGKTKNSIYEHFYTSGIGTWVPIMEAVLYLTSSMNLLTITAHLSLRTLK